VLKPPDGATAPVRHPGAPAPGEPLDAHNEHCFGCGDQANGLRMRARAGEGVGVTAEFEVHPAHQGAPGLAHGGMLSAALDEMLGALNWMQRVNAVTGRLETDFARPVPVGTVLHLEARATAVHGRKLYCAATGRIGDPEGPVAVRAEALFIELRADHFTKDDRPEENNAALAGPDQAKAARAVEVNP